MAIFAVKIAVGGDKNEYSCLSAGKRKVINVTTVHTPNLDVLVKAVVT